MKASFVYCAALCIPAVIASSMSMQAAAQQIAAMDDTLDKITETCTDLPMSCVGIVEELLQDLKEAAASKDKAEVVGVLKDHAADLKDPACAKPLAECVAKFKKGI